VKERDVHKIAIRSKYGYYDYVWNDQVRIMTKQSAFPWSCDLNTRNKSSPELGESQDSDKVKELHGFSWVFQEVHGRLFNTLL